MNQDIEQDKAAKSSFVQYVKESIVEFKKVVWPKRPDAVRMTGFVLLFVAIASVFIFGVDSAIAALIKLILVR